MRMYIYICVYSNQFLQTFDCYIQLGTCEVERDVQGGKAQHQHQGGRRRQVYQVCGQRRMKDILMKVWRGNAPSDLHVGRLILRFGATF